MNDDPIWKHFAPTWEQMKVENDALLIGGYGVILKQRWLIREANTVRTLIDAKNWPAARSTMDVDLALLAEIVLNADRNKSVRAIVNAHGWKESSDEGGRNWQFETGDGNGKLRLEFHAPVPADYNNRGDERRLKPAVSLGIHGIHARQNPEAACLWIYPTEFTLTEPDDRTIQLRVPHPVNVAAMKIIAMRDRREMSIQTQDQALSGRLRREAVKHARDVALAVAMTTLDEMEDVQTVVEAIKTTEPFKDAQRIVSNYFLKDGIGYLWIQEAWSVALASQICAMLVNWFDEATT